VLHITEQKPAIAPDSPRVIVKGMKSNY